MFANHLSLAFRFPGNKTREALMVELVSMILSNAQAGLIDLNLNQEQKILGGYSYPLNLNDYSAHILGAQPREGQTLEEVRDLLLSQLELIKQGKFDDWLLKAIIYDYKISKMREFENNKDEALWAKAIVVCEGDVEKAKKTVYANLKKNSSYYSQLNLSGQAVEPEKIKVKKSKKKPSDIDTENGMKKVKEVVKENLDETGLNLAPNEEPNEAVKQAVIAGLGYSIMPIIGIRNEIESGLLKIIPMKGLPIQTTWRLIWLKEKKLSPIAESYLNYLANEKDNIINNYFALPSHK